MRKVVAFITTCCHICLFCFGVLLPSNSLAQHGEKMPIVISWVEVLKSHNITNIPAIHYEVGNYDTSNQVEVMCTIATITKSKPEEHGMVTSRTAKPFTLKKEGGDIPRGELTHTLTLARAGYGLEGEGELRVALFKNKPVKGKEFSSERVSNWISVTVSFER
jgi:hypothetical protein